MKKLSSSKKSKDVSPPKTDPRASRSASGIGQNPITVYVFDSDSGGGNSESTSTESVASQSTESVSNSSTADNGVTRDKQSNDSFPDQGRSRSKRKKSKKHSSSEQQQGAQSTTTATKSKKDQGKTYIISSIPSAEAAEKRSHSKPSGERVLTQHRSNSQHGTHKSKSSSNNPSLRNSLQTTAVKPQVSDTDDPIPVINIPLLNTEIRRARANQERPFIAKCGLSMSDMSCVTYYYASEASIAFQGNLVFSINEKIEPPKFLSANKRSTSFNAKPCRAPALPVKNNIPLKRRATTENSDDEPVLISDSDSSDDTLLDKTYMSTSIFKNMMEIYTPSIEERKQAFYDSSIYTQVNCHHVPDIADLEGNAISLSKEEIKEPSVSFSRIFFDQSELPKNEEEDSNDSNTQPEVVVKYSRGNNLPHRSSPAAKKQQHDQACKQITLAETQTTTIKETDPDFKPLTNIYREQLEQHPQTKTKTRKNLLSFNLTTFEKPKSNSITTIEVDKKIYINLIDIDEFKAFKFGPDITEPNPDQLHIITWHNIDLDPVDVSILLSNYTLKLDASTTDTRRLKSIIQYVFLWFYLFARDFYIHQKCSDITNSTLNTVLDLNKKYCKGDQIITGEVCYLKACISSLADRSSTPESFIKPLPLPTITSTLGNTNIKELKLDSTVLVRHFTFIELELFHRIQRAELVQTNWSKSDKEKHAPNFMKVIERFNQTAVFIASSILVDSAKARAGKINYWIKAMEDAKRVRNYQLLFEIDAALSCYPVTRLEATWKLVGKKSISTFNLLHQITNPIHKAINRYKMEVSQSPKKTLPFIGPFLSEMTFVSEGNKTLKTLPNGKDGLNMEKQRSYSEIISFIFQDWGSKMKFMLDKGILEQCQKMYGGKKETQELLMPSITFEGVRQDEPDWVKKLTSDDQL